MENTPIPRSRPADRKAGGLVKFEVGMVVQHPFFGQGRIKAIPGPRRVEVSFDRHGDKILHLDYARLEPKL